MKGLNIFEDMGVYICSCPFATIEWKTGKRSMIFNNFEDISPLINGVVSFIINNNDIVFTTNYGIFRIDNYLIHTKIKKKNI